MLVHAVCSGCGGKQSVLVSLLGALGSEVVLCVGLVDLVFFLCASRCPITVASNDGGYLSRVASDRPGNGGRNPLGSAVLRVRRAGEKSAASANATRSAGVSECLLIASAAGWLVALAIGGCCKPLSCWVDVTICGQVHSPN